MIDITKKVDTRAFFANAREVYFYLEDERSRQIFEARFEYYVTKKSSKIADLVKLSSPLVQDQHKKFQQSIFGYDFAPGEEVVIYGTPFWAEWVSRYVMTTENILYCCDESGAGEAFSAYPLISFEEYLNKHKNAKIILADDQRKEAYDLLRNQGVAAENIVIGIYMDMKDQYFDELLQFSEDEIFVDVGACNAETSRIFAEHCKGKYEKIYMYEADQKNYEICLENMKKFQLERTELSNIGLWSEKTSLSFTEGDGGKSKIEESASGTISVDTLDHLLGEVPVTFLKMDIEGAEMEALKGAANCIKTHKPKLAICVYHKYEDLIDILAYIKFLVPEYKFYLRHYSNILVDTVLYAVL